MSDDVSDQHAIIGAYVVDAVDDVERAAFESHLRTCDDCLDQLAGLAQVPATIAQSHATPPPAALRERVLAQVRTTSQLPPGGSGTAPSAGVPWVRRRLVAWASAAAVGLVAAAGIGAVLQPDGAPDLAALERDVMMVSSAPDAKSMELDLGRAHLIISERMDTVAVMGYEAPALGADLEYQLWLVMNDGASMPGPTFAPGEDGDIMAITHADCEDLDYVVITVEPRGGSDEPTSAPIATVTF